MKKDKKEREMPKCPKTISGKHIWGSEVIDYSIGGSGIDTFMIPNCLLKCKACGLYDDINKPK